MLVTLIIPEILILLNLSIGVCFHDHCRFRPRHGNQRVLLMHITTSTHFIKNQALAVQLNSEFTFWIPREHHFCEIVFKYFRNGNCSKITLKYIFVCKHFLGVETFPTPVFFAIFVNSCFKNSNFFWEFSWRWLGQI